jgi:hypothetical protein
MDACSVTLSGGAANNLHFDNKSVSVKSQVNAVDAPGFSTCACYWYVASAHSALICGERKLIFECRENSRLFRFRTKFCCWLENSHAADAFADEGCRDTWQQRGSHRGIHMVTRAVNPSSQLFLVKPLPRNVSGAASEPPALTLSISIADARAPEASRIFRGVVWGMFFNFLLVLFCAAVWEVVRLLWR